MCSTEMPTNRSRLRARSPIPINSSDVLVLCRISESTMPLCGLPLYSTNHESPQAPHKRDMFRERTSGHQSREISTRMTTMHNNGRSRFAEIVVGADDGKTYFALKRLGRISLAQMIKRHV
ncbi:hypothetical protein PISMIDRAFT_536505 [Pisolithus microcarpus 441]|uniref:Uncharacterized protein n=1 Tax=Pisolithus microcarpus 441 TaxID=765257 RepID=A0A0C9YL77_9AGAM|nr:hypothetical protein PISMIDRAFT_536505 [Pisolithus microcarpus 441]